MLLCAASAVARIAGTEMIATSEALDKEITLWSGDCKPGDGWNDAQQCADDLKVLVNRLAKFAEFCDENAADLDKAVMDNDNEEVQSHAAIASWKLQARAARFYAKHPGINPTGVDAQGKTEAAAIIKERTRILSWDANAVFVKVGLLSDESIDWLTVVARGRN
jgi:hypothetical protein